MNQTNSRPIHTLRSGSIKVSIFENRSERGTFKKVVQQKVYRDSEDNWKTTSSLDEGDLLAAAELLVKAWHWLNDRDSERHGQSPTPSQSHSTGQSTSEGIDRTSSEHSSGAGSISTTRTSSHSRQTTDSTPT